MAENKKLFRKVALDRLSSPEQLDQTLQITTPKGWIALLTLAGLIGVVLFWGIFGSIPTKVSGMGIFIRGEGVKNVSAPTSGQITALYVASGDTIDKGQMIARIAQPQLVTQISQTRSKIQELKNEKDKVEQFSAKEIELQTMMNQKEKRRMNREIKNTQDQIEWLKKRKKNQEKLLNKGLITRQKYLATQQEINVLEDKIAQLINKKKQLPIKLLNLKENRKQKLRSKEMQINEVQRQLQSLQEQLEESSKVYSPHTGRILEVTANEGSHIRAGNRIASLELTGDTVSDLKVVFYAPAQQGKKIKSGMEAHISPSTVDAEEYGVMLGLVTHVNEYPATNEGMMRTLRNKRLVDLFSNRGSPLEILASPVPSPDTYSGYKWSSSKGPQRTIRSGTVASAKVTVDKQAPVTLVIPWLKKNILGIGQTMP